MFENNLLDAEGNIPELFRIQVLRTDSASSISQFMSQIDDPNAFDKMGAEPVDIKINRKGLHSSSGGS